MAAPAEAWNALGFRFTVPVESPVVRSYVSSLLAAIPVATHGSDCTEFPVIEDTSDPGWLADRLESMVLGVNLGSLGAAEGDLLLHAGAVARPDGGCAIVCGQSGSGKSTLTARLVADGLAYVTDETVCLDPDWHTITPYRKPLSLKPGSQTLFPHLGPTAELSDGFSDADTWYVAPHLLGTTLLPTATLRPEIAVFPTWSKDQQPSIRKLSVGETAFRMGRDSSRLACVRGGPLVVLNRAARSIPGYRIIYHDHRDAADTVRDLWNAVTA